MGFLDKFKLGRLKEGLAKTHESLFGKVQKILFGKTKIDDELIENLEEILIAGDVGVATAATIIENIRKRVKQDRYENPAELDGLLRDEIQKLLVNGSTSLNDPFTLPSNNKPHVVMIVGVNGVGKTTTIGKLAYNYKTAGKKVVIAAADTFRAAANEQLEIWARRAGVEIIRQAHGADPGAVAFDALKSAVAQNADLMIIDTAGRLHTKVNLMEELKKIKRVLQKIVADAPHEVLLVLDASTGQNAIQQVKHFTAAVGVTGLVLTKLDGTAKGGVVLGISNELNIPVKFIGVGEKIDDLQPFDRTAFVEALFEKQS
ncbi:MAG: signal recognition particle-docking protein FtsY [Ignavibacteria bacterium]|nr:signal recognition particle-docking protein FtsY [Ignavibacteria bacterium]MBI3765485.1 signal recognition particle-docking protein FtsY [Ignavibacteriales bacterium]